MKDHKKWVSQVFDASAPSFGQKEGLLFKYFGKRLVEHLSIKKGQHVLDVATGRGAVLFPLAEAVGADGKAVGIDISPQMVKETSKELSHRTWIELLHMDAEQLSFPDHSFDIVTCGFGIFFFPWIAKALSEFKRVLKPGGSLAVSIWGRPSKLKTFFDDELNKLGVKGLAITPIKSESSLHEILHEAQFLDIQIFEENKELPQHSPDEVWAELWTHGARAKLEQLTPSQLATFRELFKNKVQNSYPESLQVFYGIAKKT